MHLWRPTVEMASDKKIVEYTKLKEVSSGPDAEVKGKFGYCVKKTQEYTKQYVRPILH